MALNFRAVSPDEVLINIVSNGRGRQPNVSEFAKCEIGGNGYVLTEGVDYVADSSNDENIPKLSSVRQRLLNHAKKWSESRKKEDPTNQEVVVKTQTQLLKTEHEGQEMKIPVLRFWFNLGERKKRAKKVVQNTKVEQQQPQESSEVVS